MAESSVKMQCSACKKFFPSPILACAKCSTKYCSADCQRVDWPNHKSHCKVIQKYMATQSAVLAQTGNALIDDVPEGTPGLTEGPEGGALTAEFRAWSSVMGGHLVDLYREYFQISTKAGQQLSKRNTLYLQITPSATAKSFRDKFACVGCDIDRTSQPYVNAIFDEREKNPHPKGELLASVIFELNLRAIYPDAPPNHGVRQITTQFPITLEVAANTPVVSKCMAWAMFKRRMEKAWDAYDAAEGNA